MGWSWRVLLWEIYHRWVVALPWIRQQNIPLRSIYLIVSKLNRWLCLLLLNYKRLLVFVSSLIRWHDLRRHKVVVDEVIVFLFLVNFRLRLIFTIWLIEVFDDFHALNVIEARLRIYDHRGPSYDTILSGALLVSCFLSQWNFYFVVVMHQTWLLPGANMVMVVQNILNIWVLFVLVESIDFVAKLVYLVTELLVPGVWIYFDMILFLQVFIFL